MPFEITPLDHHTLETMHEILKASSGFETSLEDELMYFDTRRPSGWFVAREGEGICGFVRSFAQGAEWSLGELYVAPGLKERAAVARELLTCFSKHNSFSPGHRLRFDVPASDLTLNSRLEEMGFSEKRQLFRHYELSLARWAETATAATEGSGAVTGADARGVAAVFENLHSVTEDEVKAWIEQGTIEVIRSQGGIVAAAQIYRSGDEAEINRLATLAECLRQGFAKQLLNQICVCLADEKRLRVYLKVEAIREPARRLYQSVGFEDVLEKAQIWHSRWF